MQIWSERRLSDHWRGWDAPHRELYRGLLSSYKPAETQPREAATRAAREVTGITEEVEADVQEVVDIFGGEVTSVETYDLYDGTPPHEKVSTSLAAAEEIGPDVAALQGMVLRVIAASEDGMTDEEILDITLLNPNTARPRRRELYLKGLIYSSGTRKNRSGRSAKVWRRRPKK